MSKCNYAIDPFLLAQSFNPVHIFALEIQQELVSAARLWLSNFKFVENVEVIEGDVREVNKVLLSSKAHVVVTNPPYRTPGTGKIAPHPERASARHELHGGLDDFLKAAAYLLGDGGRFYIVYLAERLTDLLEGMRKHRLEPKRLRCVHGRSGDVAKMVLAEGRKGGRPGLKLEQPLIVYDGEQYTPEVQAIYERYRELWEDEDWTKC